MGNLKVQEVPKGPRGNKSYNRYLKVQASEEGGGAHTDTDKQTHTEKMYQKVQVI